MEISPKSTLVDYLGALPYFGLLDSDRLSALASQCQRYTFSSEEAIFWQNEPSLGMWLIEHGRVKIYKLNPDGEEHILHLLGSGSTFNDIASLDKGPNPANAAALTQSTIWLLPTSALHNLFANDTALALQAIQILAARVRLLAGQIEDLALYSVTIRLARFLLKQAEDPALSGPGVTRAAIAAHLATKPETISRALRSLEQAEAISFDRHQIVIVREDLLRSIAAL